MNGLFVCLGGGTGIWSNNKGNNPQAESPKEVGRVYKGGQRGFSQQLAAHYLQKGQKMFGRRINWLFAAALLLFALIELIDAQYTAPGAYYVYAPGYNFNPPPPGPGGPGTVGKRSAEPVPSPTETANGTATVTRRSVQTMESHTNGTEPTKRNAVTNGHGNVTEHQ